MCIYRHLDVCERKLEFFLDTPVGMHNIIVYLLTRRVNHI